MMMFFDGLSYGMGSVKPVFLNPEVEELVIDVVFIGFVGDEVFLQQSFYG